MLGFQKIAAAILIPMLIASAIIIIVLKGNIPDQSVAWHTVETQPGQKSILDLPDGTRVWMNSETSLSYPIVFMQKQREIKLRGEAFFEVAHDKKRAFVVEMNELAIHVLGTEFNVANYGDENEDLIYLKSGAIALHTNTNNSDRVLYRMKPGEQAVYRKDVNELLIRSGLPDICMAWLDGKLVFRDESMESVVRKLNRWFNVEISIDNREIEDYRYTATFQHESLEQILDLLKKSAPIDYEIIHREKEDDDIFTKTRVELFAP